MPEATLVGQLPQILLRGVGVAFAGGGTLTGPGPRAVSEFARLTAVFVMTTGTAPAAGFPRIIQSVDGVSSDIITALTLDTSQSHAVVYTGDVSLMLPYVFVQHTNGGVATSIDYLVQGWPSGASASSSSSSSGGGVAPTGSVVSYAAAAAPSGWLLCDGTIYNIATYPTLGALLGSTWGGNGTTTFAVPDSRGRSPLGSGTGSGLTARTLAQTGGEELHVLSTGELATHAHGVTDPGHRHVLVQQSAGGGALTVFATTAFTSTASTGATVTTGPLLTDVTGISIANNGSSTGHNTMHPFNVFTMIIKT